MRAFALLVWLGLVITVPFAPSVCAAEATVVKMAVSAEGERPLDRRIFGQFLERPSWSGEIGVEAAALPETGRLKPEVVEMLRAMQIPIVRFPGGTDIDYTDWTDMVSNAYGRENPGRPVTVGHQKGSVTNRFGFDEFFALQDELRAETILVVNLRDALYRVRSVEETANRAAGLVAYVNAPVGAKMPTGVPDWAAVRAKNGHPEPYGVKLFQIGNETYFFWPPSAKDKEALGIRTVEEAAARYRDCVIAIADKMREVDPSIEFILDTGVTHTEADTRACLDLVAKDPEIRKRVRYLSIHTYSPMGLWSCTRGDQKASYMDMNDEELWYSLVSRPGTFDAEGQAMAFGPWSAHVRSLGYEVVSTEWNWSGYNFEKSFPNRVVPHGLASALGAAGFFHGMMRDCDNVKIATQSMLVGNRWDITAVRVDPEGRVAPFYYPQGHVALVYGAHHGDRLLNTKLSGVPQIAQPWAMDNWTPEPSCVALVDALATRGEGRLYVHAINRHYSEPMVLEAEVSAFIKEGPAKAFVIVGEVTALPKSGNATRLLEGSEGVKGGVLRVVLPPRSVNVFEVPLK